MNTIKSQLESLDDILDLNPDIHKKAIQGDSFAQLDVGQACFSTGNYEKAFYWFKLAAEQKNMKAQFMLGNLCTLGEGIEKNEFKAFEWYTKSAIQGYPKALTRLHNLYHTKVITCNSEQKDSGEAEQTENKSKEQDHIRKLFEKAAEAYNTDILSRIGVLCQSSSNERPDDIKTSDYYRSATEKEDTDAPYIPETQREQEESARMNYLEALKWLTLAAASQESNNTQSHDNNLIRNSGSKDLFFRKWFLILSNLIDSIEYIEECNDSFWGDVHFQIGYMLCHGYGVPIDYEKAWNSFKISGIQYGEKRAVGLLTIDSEDIDISMKRGYLKKLRMLEAVFEQLQSEEIYELGVIHYKGVYAKSNNERYLIIEPNHNKSIEYFKTIVGKELENIEEYYSESSYYLGMIHYVNTKHKQVSSNASYYLENASHYKYTDTTDLLESVNSTESTAIFKKVMRWHIENQSERNLNLMYNIGWMYDEGFGTKRDYREAAKYYEIVAEQEYDVAYFRLGRMYYSGCGVESDYSGTIKWYKKAAQQNHTLANYYLGNMYFKAQGVDKDEEEAFKYYKVAAEQGYSNAQYKLGRMYSQSDAIKNDHIEALKWYKKAAEQNNALANYSAGSIYYRGLGVDKDYKEAIKYYIASAELGDVDAQCKLGYIYDKGYGVEKDYTTAIKWYKKAAKQNNSVANYNLGSLNYNGRGVNKNYKEATKYYRVAATNGDIDAQCKLAYMYNQGYGVKIDYVEAIRWYKMAAEQDNIVANYNLGNIYFNGDGISKNYSEAIKYYTIAAEQGYKDAQFQMGHIYDRGYGVEKNDSEAVEWYKKAAEQGDVIATYNVGVMYYKGRGVDLDYNEAFRYFEFSAENGYDFAQFQLGYMYNFGHGIEVDNNVAIHWYKKSIDQNNVHAMFYLGDLYYNGEGADKDYGEALKYFKLAADKGYVEAQFQLGYCYLKGYGTDKDENKGLELMIEASNKDEDKLVDLGEIYHSTNSEIRSFSKAMDFYQRISGGIQHSYALRGIGLLYEHGDGVDQNYQEALMYYNKAADQKNKGAYYNIALLYYYGIGVAKDYAITREWLHKIIVDEVNDGCTYVCVQFKSGDDSTEETNPNKQKEYSLEPESFIYGEAHYYLGIMYEKGQGTNINIDKSVDHLKVAISHKSEKAEEHFKLLNKDN